MHYGKRYRLDESESYRQGCLDALRFMGPTVYKVLARVIMSGANDNQIAFLASLGGVQGFPVSAMIDRYRNT
jgi:hypothetical protein